MIEFISTQIIIALLIRLLINEKKNIIQYGTFQSTKKVQWRYKLIEYLPDIYPYLQLSYKIVHYFVKLKSITSIIMDHVT